MVLGAKFENLIGSYSLWEGMVVNLLGEGQMHFAV